MLNDQPFLCSRKYLSSEFIVGDKFVKISKIKYYKNYSGWSGWELAGSQELINKIKKSRESRLCSMQMSMGFNKRAHHRWGPPRASPLINTPERTILYTSHCIANIENGDFIKILGRKM